MPDQKKDRSPYQSNNLLNDLFSEKDQACINAIRGLSIDAIDKANSGHPGLPLGAAPFAYVLWHHFMNHSPQNPSWPNRDRFILSAGHGSMLIYSLLHLSGYSLTLKDLKEFRQWKSLTPGHPEFHLTPGIETTTGPLGQGAANAVGFAIAERHLAAIFNKPEFELVHHYTYALVSDGDLMEGVAQESVSLAGHLGLGKLIYLYDSNQVTLDGPTSLTFAKEDTRKRFEGCGWHVQEVKNADSDLNGIHVAIAKARNEKSKPSLIIMNTTIGFGSPIAGTSEVHGSPLKGEALLQTKKSLGLDTTNKFEITEGVQDHFISGMKRGSQAFKAWNELFQKYTNAHPEEALLWERYQTLNPDLTWKNAVLESLSQELIAKNSKPKATRVSSGTILNQIAVKNPWLIGGDADLSSSTKTALKDAGSFDGQTGSGRNIHFGVREHAMASIANGMSYHSGLRPFVSTFFCFFDYMKPGVRLAAMNQLPVIYIWTHDSIGLGEDGPTHQPIEHLMALRGIPNLIDYRPADSLEVALGWEFTLQDKKTPFGFVLTRQNLPELDRTKTPSDLGAKKFANDPSKGAYILIESDPSPKVILIASGSEVHLAVAAHAELLKKNIHSRVVSMPSWTLFRRQPDAYQDLVLPPEIQERISIEAGITLGWEKWIGLKGRALGIDHFGASAPAEILYEKFGLTVNRIVEESVKLSRN